MDEETLPGRFESRLDEDPFAAAVTLRRPNGVVRVWTRAAVEHRAVRVGAFCAQEGLAAGARVAVTASGALDALAVVWFTLASGRVLATPDLADFVVDDQRLAGVPRLQEGYTLRSLVLPKDPALAFRDEVVDHAALTKLVAEPRITPILEGMTWVALQHLETGESIEVAPGGVVTVPAASSAA